MSNDKPFVTEYEVKALRERALNFAGLLTEELKTESDPDILMAIGDRIFNVLVIKKKVILSVKKKYATKLVMDDLAKLGKAVNRLEI